MSLGDRIPGMCKNKTADQGRTVYVDHGIGLQIAFIAMVAILYAGLHEYAAENL